MMDAYQDALRSGGWGSFPFGLPNCRRSPTRPSGRARLAVLGVYPSAFHVTWAPPDGSPGIAALAVDVEPTVFWRGDEVEQRAQRITDWKERASITSDHGSFASASFNGSSGDTVFADVLVPLGVAYDECFFTDCVPFFFIKMGKREQGHAISTRWQPYATKLGWRGGDLPRRPSDARLAEMAAMPERGLVDELAEARTDVVLTLGQPAADVFARLADVSDVPPGLPLHHMSAAYGQPGRALLRGRSVTWVPLAHPGATRRPPWRKRHDVWKQGQPFGRATSLQ